MRVTLNDLISLYNQKTLPQFFLMTEFETGADQWYTFDAVGNLRSMTEGSELSFAKFDDPFQLFIIHNI